MSKQLSKDDVLFRQRFLSCCGFYADTLDGLWGKNTDDAEAAFAARSAEIAQAEGTFDARTERTLFSLRCDAQAAARRSLAAIRAAGHDARAISGTRTYPEQQALYRQGRFGNPGPIVTKAQAGQSWHNFGLAWDIGLFNGGQYVTNDAPYVQVGPIGRTGGVEWGGDWKSFKDNPHYQFGTGGMAISAARAVFEAGGR
ncbi:MAG: M15 family metallopeptidase [Proteobacteria bacterium]|nr:M15 family metallopeptidase [Pseudomonadota bacterium]